MGNVYELQRGLGDLKTLVEDTARLLPGQSTVRNVRVIHERARHGRFDGSYLELG